MKYEETRKQNFGRNLRKTIHNPIFSPLAIMVLLMIITVILKPQSLSYNFIKLNFKTFTPLILVSMAQAIVLISGSVDLSIGATLSLCVVIASSLMADSAINNILVVLLMVIVGVICGLFNGLIIGKLRLPSLISTYATQAIFFGIAMFIMPVPGGYVPPPFYRLYNANIFGFIPAPVIILAIGIGLWFGLSKMRIYRYIYAIGSSESSAKASGLNVSIIRLMAHVLAGIFVAIASVCLLMQFASGDARSGLGFTMNSVAAVVIGGVSLSGGKGSIPGAIIGALIMGMLTNIIFYANLSSLYQGFAKGMIIVLALALASIPRLRRAKLAN